MKLLNIGEVVCWERYAENIWCGELMASVILAGLTSQSWKAATFGMGRGECFGLS
jgi:hypothetical protein